MCILCHVTESPCDADLTQLVCYLWGPFLPVKCVIVVMPSCSERCCPFALN